jgi:hypothetical protein
MEKVQIILFGRKFQLFFALSAESSLPPWGPMLQIFGHGKGLNVTENLLSYQWLVLTSVSHPANSVEGKNSSLMDLGEQKKPS